MKRILHLSVILAMAFGLCGYHTLNKCQKELVNSKCIVSGCYFGMILYMNNKAQIDTYCASQMEPPVNSNAIEFFKEPVKPNIEINGINPEELKINEINPKGKTR